jgi:hypothetical protein
MEGPVNVILVRTLTGCSTVPVGIVVAVGIVATGINETGFDDIVVASAEISGEGCVICETEDEAIPDIVGVVGAITSEEIDGVNIVVVVETCDSDGGS